MLYQVRPDPHRSCSRRSMYRLGANRRTSQLGAPRYSEAFQRTCAYFACIPPKHAYIAIPLLFSTAFTARKSLKTSPPPPSTATTETGDNRQSARRCSRISPASPKCHDISNFSVLRRTKNSDHIHTADAYRPHETAPRVENVPGAKRC